MVAPVVPAVGDTVEIVGVVVETVKVTPFEAWELTVTSTLPVVALAGTAQVSELAAQLEQVAVIPLNVTVLEPCDAPKVVPLITTFEPTAPLAGDRPVI